MKFYLLGAPPKQESERYIRVVSQRYKKNFTGFDDENPENAEDKFFEGAVEWAHRLVDRQITKASGILTFNGLILYFGGDGFKEYYSKFPLVVSCILCMVIFFVMWSKDERDYASFESEFRHAMKTTMLRAKLLTFSMALSVLGLIIVACRSL